MMNDTEYYMSDITVLLLFFFSSRRRHTRSLRDWSSDVCSSDLTATNQRGEVAIDWARWVMVHKRDQDAATPETVVPELRSEERRVGKSVDLGGRRIIKKKKKK